MTEPQKREFKHELINLIQKSEDASIRWTQANPTTYVYNPMGIPGTIILQRRSPVSVVFRTVNGEEEMLVVDSSEEGEIGTLLRRLYDAAMANFDARGLNFSKTMLANLHEPEEGR
jgi:hypothetical protein